MGGVDTEINERFQKDLIGKVLRDGLGWNLDDPNFQDTPARWLKFMREYSQPYDATEDLSKTFPPKVPNGEFHTLLVQDSIPYQALCAHHLAPVIGDAYVGYISTDKAVGLSKLTRLVQGISHRSPSLQEDVCNEVVDSLQEHLAPLGSICLIRAEHGCMACRGVSRPGIFTTTVSLRGIFKERHSLVTEFYSIVGMSKG